jgi:hypothetical protein
MKKTKNKKLLLLVTVGACIANALLASNSINVNGRTFEFPPMDGLTLATERAEIKEAFPLVDEDYRHITHFVAYENEVTVNPIVGRFTTPTRSVGARIKPRKEFIKEVIDFKYDEEAGNRLKEEFKKAQTIIEDSQLDLSIESLNSGLLTPVIIDYDENGFYQAQIVEGIRAGGKFTQATIAASTVINETFFILYIGKDYSGAATPHGELLQIAKEFMEDFVDRNELK